MEDYLWGKRSWKYRYELIGKHIPKNSSVLDLGGGLGHLKKFLDPSCSYVSVDKYPLPGVIISDFEAGEYPKFHFKFKFIVCSGLVEYLSSIADFLREIKQYGNTLIISYYYREVPVLTWKNNFKIAKFESILRTAGWKIISKDQCLKQDQYVYVCKL